jgi:hypothetical protein
VIGGLLSHEKEELKFVEEINREGNNIEVEKQMIELEKRMRDSLKRQFVSAYQQRTENEEAGLFLT